MSARKKSKHRYKIWREKNRKKMKLYVKRRLVGEGMVGGRWRGGGRRHVTRKRPREYAEDYCVVR